MTLYLHDKTILNDIFEKLILQTLKDSARCLKEIDKGDCYYQEERYGMVKAIIEHLNQKINALYKDYNPQISLPSLIGFFSAESAISLSKSNSEFLKNCLLKAKNEISSERVDSVPQMPF